MRASKCQRASNALRATTFLALVASSAAFCAGPSSGPDIIVGELEGLAVARAVSGKASLFATTISCNAGNVAANWKALPDARHPVITQSLYRLSAGVLQQIGQSGVKHGFFALQNSAPCKWVCDPFNGDAESAKGEKLGPGCADPYSGPLIDSQDYVGPRSKINPSTGAFDGATAADPGQQPFGRELQVNTVDLETSGARYFVEGQYIAADDLAAGNGSNSVSYREVAFGPKPNNLTITEAGKTHRGCPAILAWEDATFTAKDLPGDGRLIAATHVSKLGGQKYRIDLALYNMTSDHGISSISIATKNLTVDTASVGFSAPISYGEGWSNDPWKHSVQKGQINWFTQRAAENSNGNALRWGQTFNYWFEAESSAEPMITKLTLVPFKGRPDEVITIALDGAISCDAMAYR